ncbi:tyrosine-protein phosphatase [Butyricimonas hominis]|uniref:protein-tyrosine-phosphatase n=1 Tax=Butyricimonas hominis TaxID=2763032 RepID=A0ABR7CZT5_9BACT|nr:CpsB/CapC family capsule biosynthesis tyrosine phosphatase [Butyricimonas hominis]MBC5621198.1 hypothetical protein [Butyricimonas hominis]
MLFLKRHRKFVFDYKRDVHSHVLPALDDGVRTMDEAILIIRRMVAAGLCCLTCTPHVAFPALMNSRGDIGSMFVLLKSRLVQEGIDIAVDMGAEYRMGEFMLGLLEQNEIIASAAGEVLVEHSFVAPSVHAEEIIFRLRGSGYVPVMAHPERYSFYAGDIVKHCEHLKLLGCKIQVNLLSFAGYYGKEALTGARKLYGTGLVDYYAGDIHNLRQEMLLEKLIGGAFF